LKLQITIDEKPMSGYNYITPINGQDLSNLDNNVLDNECTEIFAPRILDYIPLEKTQTIIERWVKKMRHGGKIVLGGTDIYEVAKLIMTGTIDSKQTNIIIFGNQSGVWGVKRAAISLNDVCDLLIQLGLKNYKKRG
jgi:hypothetical protein